MFDDDVVIAFHLILYAKKRKVKYNSNLVTENIIKSYRTIFDPDLFYLKTKSHEICIKPLEFLLNCHKSRKTVRKGGKISRILGELVAQLLELTTFLISYLRLCKRWLTNIFVIPILGTFGSIKLKSNTKRFEFGNFLKT